MRPSSWIELSPSLMLAVGIILATLAAVLAADSRWLVMSGPLLQALSVAGAGALHSRLQGGSLRPNCAALLQAGAFLLAGGMVALVDPKLVGTLIATQGVLAWMTLLAPRAGKGRTCSPDSWV